MNKAKAGRRKHLQIQTKLANPATNTKSRSEQSLGIMRQAGVYELLREIESYCYKNAVLTFAGQAMDSGEAEQLQQGLVPASLLASDALPIRVQTIFYEQDDDEDNPDAPRKSRNNWITEYPVHEAGELKEFIFHPDWPTSQYDNKTATPAPLERVDVAHTLVATFAKTATDLKRVKVKAAKQPAYAGEGDIASSVAAQLPAGVEAAAEPSEVRYEDSNIPQEQLAEDILAHAQGIIILRSPTEELDPQSGLFFHEVRAWRIQVVLDSITTTTAIESKDAAHLEIGDNRRLADRIISRIVQPHLVWQRLSPDEVREASNTPLADPHDDSESDEARHLESGRGQADGGLTPEKAVRYC